MIIWPKDMESEYVRAGINAILARSWTEDGIYAWWRRPRAVASGYSPQELFDQGDWQEVIDLADSGREMGGS